MRRIAGSTEGQSRLEFRLFDNVLTIARANRFLLHSLMPSNLVREVFGEESTRSLPKQAQSQVEGSGARDRGNVRPCSPVHNAKRRTGTPTTGRERDELVR